MKSLANVSGNTVLGKGDLVYRSVIDDFQNTSFIGVLTYNISSKDRSELLQALKSACHNGAKVLLITNIPKRFPRYYGDSYANAARRTINAYLDLLKPQNFGPQMESCFLFCNHAKIIVTDNVAYWGSSNFSDESKDNFECGTISTDKEVIHYLKEELFPSLKEKSIPYYKHNFVQAIYLLGDAAKLCRDAQMAVFEASFVPYEDYDTNFETRWVYNTQHSGITRALLEKFTYDFQQYEEALQIIVSIIDEYWDVERLPDDVARLQTISENYTETFDRVQGRIDELFDCINELSMYDVDEEAARKLSDEYGLEAFDERLDYYAQKSFQEASEEYEDLIKSAKPIIHDIMEQLSQMSQYLSDLAATLQTLLEVDSRIDNTSGV